MSDPLIWCPKKCRSMYPDGSLISGGQQCCRGTGQEAELENERRRGRFWRKPRRLSTDGRRDARLHSDRRAQNTRGRGVPA